MSEKKKEKLTAMTFDEEQWSDMRDSMVLAMHHVMLGGQFRDEYWKEYNRLRSQSREQRGDNILRELFGEPDQDE
jgi:hypothetical protein